jgi:HlyD family secretion protein
MKIPAKTLVSAAIALVIAALFAGTLWFLWAKSRPKPVGVETEKPFVADIVKKVIASGTIEPRQEIEIKPRISGILRRVVVEPGMRVKAGDLIGEVQVIPDVVNLNEAELRLQSAKVTAERARRELERGEVLGQRGVTALGDLEKLRADEALARQELEAAENRVLLVREGIAGKAARGNGASTRIEATVSGTVLQVPVKPGSSVINASSFNPGTTVASIADMTDLVFRGLVDESDVGELRPGMPVEIVVSALRDRKLSGKLERIAPKSQVKDGTIEFEIEAALKPTGDALVRAGYSANANIVLDRRSDVLAINESLLVFDNGRSFVDVEVAPGHYERREVKLGLSDSVRIEVLSGVTAGMVLKKPKRLETMTGRF